MKRIKHNDLTHYFLRDHKDLPPAYLASCKKFFDSICWPDYYGGGPDTKNKIFRLRDYRPKKLGRVGAVCLIGHNRKSNAGDHLGHRQYQN